jgi:hypothetical protein
MTTAARPPQYDISLDTLDRQGSLRDYQRADAALVRTIEAQQHALMCGWGTPPQCFSFRLAIGQSTGPLVWTTDFLLRVPPFCTKMRVAALMAGAFEVYLQVGALQRVRFAQVGSTSEGVTTWLEGSATPTQGNDSGFLEVLAAQQATWQTVGVRLTALEDATGLHSLAFYPLLEQAV